MFQLLSVLASVATLIFENLLGAFYRTPLFRSRCESSGRNLVIRRLPSVFGHTRIYVGHDVQFAGVVTITSGRILDNPRLVIGDGVTIGDLVNFSVNREIVVESGVSIGPKCYLADNDGHPLQASARASGASLAPEDVITVRIGRNAKLGYESYVLKGVTVGEGAIVQPRSVVTSDIPPYARFGGSPARPVA